MNYISQLIYPSNLCLAMATVEYDLDTSGGLMEEIQKLISPPVNEETLRRQRRQEREYRRPGRAVNHDCCDSCKEGGDLLCCDRCPAAFHLQCHDPPLDEDDVPPGEWICHRCKVAPQKDDDASSTKSGSSTHSKGGKSRNNQSTPPLVLPTDMEVDGEECTNPLQMLAKAAKIMNPIQFSLPKDIACTTSLPGSSKRKWWGKDRTAQKKVAHELDNGMVPLPAKTCFTCSRSCRVGALLPCDFCPLLYHLDCLTPPLTSVPTGRWMCPYHPEHMVDEKLLQSESLTERVKLWDMFSGNLNQHNIKVSFLSKIHRQYPPFRLKVKHPPRKSAVIPSAIKEFYKNPPALLPRSFQSVSEETRTCEQDQATETTLEEQEEWLTSVVSLQTSIAKHLAQRQIQKSDSNVRTSESVKLEKPTASVQPVIHGDFQPSNQTETSDSGAKSAQTSNSDIKMCNTDDDKSLLNGPYFSQDGLSNGPLDISKGGAISLLHPPPGHSSSSSSSSSSVNTTSSSVNGDLDVVDFAKSKHEAVLIRSRSDSVDGSQPNIVRVNWASDKNSSTVTTTPSGKNIVISAINKSNNTVVTKVLGSNQGSKIISANNLAVKNSSGSGSTSILSPRISGQQKVTNLQGKAGSTSGTPPSPKIITVSAPPSGSKSSSSSGSSSSSSGKSSSSSSSAVLSLNSALQQCLDGSADVELGKLDEKLVQILAWQRLQQLLPSKQPNSSSTSSKKGVLNGLLTQSDDSKVKARAVLCPLTGKGQPITMSYRTLSIGTGADMEVCLTQFGACSYISPKHAQIFYDETTKHYELLNYSEHGTTVDNVLYSCDFSDKLSSKSVPTPVVAAVRKIIKKGKAKKEEKQEEERITMSSSSEVKKVCNCKASSSSLIGGSGAGWEGTALLHHGSYIKVGCLQFVFSIVDHATNSMGQDRKKEPMSLLKSTLKASTP